MDQAPPQCQALLWGQAVTGQQSCRECVRLVNSIEGRSVGDIFGWPDNLKVRSSMTLFARATADNAEFVRLLEKFYGGEQDPATVALLSARP